MNFYTDKIDNIRKTITNVDSTAFSTSASFIAPKEKPQCFTTKGQDELNKRITASKPIKFHISYKILLLAYKALNGLAPAYLTNLISRYNPTRSLRSQNSGLLVVPMIAKSTKGGRMFSYLAPKLLNTLPDNVCGSGTLALFKSRLKTHLFSQAFIWCIS